MFDIDLTDPVADLPLSPGDEGAAILVRRKGVPLAFWMQSASGAACIPAVELISRMGLEAAAGLVAGAIRDEMAPHPCPRLPPLTVAICTRDRPSCVDRLLRVLCGSIVARSGTPIEVLLVDSAPSNDATRDLVARWPEVRYVCETRQGLNRARNRALREARGELLAFLDDDVIPDGQWLEGLTHAWSSNRDAAAFTGQVLPLELETEAQIIFERRGGFRRGFRQVRYGPVLPGNPSYPGGAGLFGAGANMAFVTAFLRELGGFDEALDTGRDVPGGGDLDIFYRVVRSGRPLVYEPGFLVFHQHRRDMADLRRQYRRSWGLGFMCFVGKCFQTDPERRVDLARLVLWWFSHQLIDLLKQVKRRARGEDWIPPSMLANELVGGVLGLLGGYARSRRRVARMQEDPAPDATGPARGSGPAVPARRARRADPERVITSFRPWKIVDVLVDERYPGLYPEAGTGGLFVVFWCGGIPLGQLLIPASLLPLDAAQVAEAASHVIAPAVGHHLLRRGFEAPWPVPWRKRARRAPPDLAGVLKLDCPLAALSRKPSEEAQGTESPVTVSVIVCTRNRPQHLRRCLQSIHSLAPLPDEVIVVDNDPGSGVTRQVTDDFPTVRYAPEPRPGLSAARNTGIRLCRGTIVAFTDDDVVVHPNWIGAVRTAFGDACLSAMTGLVLPAELATAAQYVFQTAAPDSGWGYRAMDFDGAFFEATRWYGAPVWRLGAGANMAFRRSVFERVGAFDERLGAGTAGCSEDSEVWYRLLADGGLCRYTPAAVVFHHHRSGWNELDAQMFSYMRGHVAALLFQFDRYGHWGNVYRALLALPWHLTKLACRAAADEIAGFFFRSGPSPLRQPVTPQIMGGFAGFAYYARHRARPVDTRAT